MKREPCPECKGTGLISHFDDEEQEFCTDCVDGTVRVSGNEDDIDLPTVTVETPTGPIRGHLMRITRLNSDGSVDAEAEPIEFKGSVTGRITGYGEPNVQEIDPPEDSPLAGIKGLIPKFQHYTADITFLPISRFMLAMVLGHRWPMSAHLQEMGACWEFDYADMPSDEQDFQSRLSRCYEIAGTAVVSTDAVRSLANAEHLPMPEVLVHGKWSSPETRDAPIDHAWVVLDDGSIWEPISKTICDAEAFARYTQCVSANVYDAQAAAYHMVTSGHYGRWA